MKMTAEGCRNFWSELRRIPLGAIPMPTSTPPFNPGGGSVPTSPTSAPARTPSRPPPSEPPAQQPSAGQVDKQVPASQQEVGDLDADCKNKWLVITITRHTKHNFGGRWDCTVGTLKMELWDTENAGSGKLVFQCDTSERGGPASTAFSSSANRPGYAHYNAFMIVARDTYGLAPHSTKKYKTYGYSKAYLAKARPGIAIYGTGSGAMDRRDGVLIHAGTNHRWSVGCIVLHRNGSVSGGRFAFAQGPSVNALLEFLEKIHQFAGKSSLPLQARIPRVKLRIRESF